MLSLGNDKTTWNIVEDKITSNKLLPNTNYYITLSFTGYEYELKVSTDGKKFSNYTTIYSREPLGLRKAVLFIGINNSTDVPVSPFKGYINLTSLSTSVEDIIIEEWFEQDPIREEDTFNVKASLDPALVSGGFFQKFAVQFYNLTISLRHGSLH